VQNNGISLKYYHKRKFIQLFRSSIALRGVEVHRTMALKASA